MGRGAAHRLPGGTRGARTAQRGQRSPGAGAQHCTRGLSRGTAGPQRAEPSPTSRGHACVHGHPWRTYRVPCTHVHVARAHVRTHVQRPRPCARAHTPVGAGTGRAARDQARLRAHPRRPTALRAGQDRRAGPDRYPPGLHVRRRVVPRRARRTARGPPSPPHRPPRTHRARTTSSRARPTPHQAGGETDAPAPLTTPPPTLNTVTQAESGEKDGEKIPERCGTRRRKRWRRQRPFSPARVVAPGSASGY